MTETRRGFLRVTALGVLGTVVSDAAAQTRAESPAPAASSTPPPVSGDEALRKLVEGNRRHLSGQFTITTGMAERRQAVRMVQRPFAAILGCSDSRLPPEIVFDHSLGDLFVVRVAGNILNDPGLGSLEFAVTQFGTPLILVLGHARCGAVAAALNGTPVPGHILSVVDAILPAVASAKGQAGDPLDNAIRANIRLTVDRLRSAAPILGDRVKAGQLKVVGAEYNLDTGQVELIA